MLKCASFEAEIFYATYACMLLVIAGYRDFMRVAAPRPYQVRHKVLFLRRTVSTSSSPNPDATAYITKAFR
jgi:hypothetical protein